MRTTNSYDVHDENEDLFSSHLTGNSLTKKPTTKIHAHVLERLVIFFGGMQPQY